MIRKDCHIGPFKAILNFVLKRAVQTSYDELTDQQKIIRDL